MGTLDLPFIEREINGTLYRATTLTLENWAELTETLSEIVGDPLASVLRGDAVMGRDLLRSDWEVLIGGFIGKITKGKILKIAGHMAKGLRAGDHLLTSANQSMWWPNHMKDLGPVIRLFLEAQYLDFFEGMAGSLPEISEIAAGQGAESNG